MGEEGYGEETVLCEDGVIFIRRRAGDKDIYLGIMGGLDSPVDTPDVLVKLNGKQQQALREAVRAMQSKGMHRWP